MKAVDGTRNWRCLESSGDSKIMMHGKWKNTYKRLGLLLLAENLLTEIALGLSRMGANFKVVYLFSLSTLYYKKKEKNKH